MRTDWKEKARHLKRYIPALFLALRRKDTPIAAKILAGITVAYALSPIDLIPDFVPVLGYLDDLLILPALIAWTIRLIPRDVMDACLEESEGLWQKGKPKRWYYAIPILLIYAALIGLLFWKWVL